MPTCHTLQETLQSGLSALTLGDVLRAIGKTSDEVITIPAKVCANLSLNF